MAALNGIASSQLRSATVVEVTAGTTPATPAFQTLHQPIIFDDNTERGTQASLNAGGGNVGDTLMYREAKGTLADADMVYAAYDKILESALQSSWAADAMTDGKASQSFTCENSWAAGNAGTMTYKRYRGVEAMNCSFKSEARGKVKFSADFLGRQSIDTATSIVTGATYTDPTNKDPFSATTDIGAITIAGYTLDDCMSMEMNLNYRDREGQPKIGGDSLAGIGRGVFDPMLKFRFYVQEGHALLYDAPRLATQTGAKITVNIGSVTLKKYRFEWWDCNITKGVINWSGANAILEIEAQPKYKVSNLGFLTMTRAIV